MSARAADLPAPSSCRLNPKTGLSTDYLNHFTEAAMMLEMVVEMPECLDDLRGWQPRTYREHFAASYFADRDAIIIAYDAAPPMVRDTLDSTAETLNAVLVEARTAVIEHLATPLAATLSARAANWIKPLIARIGGAINGADMAPAASHWGGQTAIDRLFDR